jgi:hypothetical protein
MNPKAIAWEGPLCSFIFYKNGKGVSMATPSMAFCIVIDSHARILKQCIGWPTKPLLRFLQKRMLIKIVLIHFL